MAVSKYEKYITRRAQSVLGAGADGVVKFGVPESFRISDRNIATTGPRLIFSNDTVKEADSKIEYGWILRDMVLLNSSKDFGAHKHDYAEIFIFFGNDPYDTSYLGGEGEFWMGEGDNTEKIRFDTSCSIYMPAGVGHFPLYFRKVKTPIMMGVIVPAVGDFVLVPIKRS